MPTLTLTPTTANTPPAAYRTSPWKDLAALLSAQISTRLITPIWQQPAYRYGLQMLAMALLYFSARLLSLAVSQQNLIVTVVIFTAEGFALGGILL